MTDKEQLLLQKGKIWKYPYLFKIKFKNIKDKICSPACRAMWRPLVLLLLLLLPVNPVPTAAAAPILDANVQDNLQSLGAQGGGDQTVWAAADPVPNSGCPPGS
uniref:Uncharacterized protein n=1 Tax=Rousettus aegyptiacus TaxID=9407 RepID=A0A7J8FJ93_ROUAE|nr:hypothetical protein HJG63_012051 [Rousettus aegyptiacus]